MGGTRTGQVRRDHFRRAHEDAPSSLHLFADTGGVAPAASHLHTGTGRLVLLSVCTTVRSISENTLNAALRRMGYTTDEVTAHGFRATAPPRQRC